MHQFTHFSKTFLAIATFSIALCPTAYSKAAQVKLSWLIKNSDLIALGTVTEVSSVGKFRVAKLQIEGVLKGDAQIRETFFLASPTWTCDVSNAKVGERGMYFLAKAKANSEFPSEQNGQPIYLINHSGSGRWLANGQGKFDISSMVILPDNFPVERSSQANGAHLKLVSSKDIVREIRKTAITPN